MRTWIVGGLLLILGFAAGFQYAGWAAEPQSPEPEQPEADPLPAESFTVTAEDIASYPQSLVGETTWDLDQDGTDESIELYVDAAREQGQFIWDDGQRWLFMVRDGDKTYPLYDDFVPLGVLEFWVFSKDPQLVFKVDGGVRLAVYTVKHDAAAGGYVVSPVLRAENLMHRTVIH